MLALRLVALLGLVYSVAARSVFRRSEAMPDPSAVAAPFFPFVGRVAVLTPKDKLKDVVSQAYNNMSLSDMVGNFSAADILGFGDGNETNSSSSASSANASTATGGLEAANVSEVTVSDADSPLLGNASAEVQEEVSKAMQQAEAHGAEQVEETVEKAKEKWVGEAKILEMEDSAKMDEAVREDLADVKEKVEAVRSVQINALQSMADDVKAAMANITQTALQAAVNTTRREGEQHQYKVLSPSLRTIQYEEGSIEHLQSDTMQHLQAARGHAQRLKAATAVAHRLSQNFSTSPEDIAAGLRKHVAQSMAKARSAKESVESILSLAREAAVKADALFEETNTSEAAARSLLDRAVAQAKQLQQLEQRTATAAKQAAVTELLKKAGLVGEASPAT